MFSVTGPATDRKDNLAVFCIYGSEAALSARHSVFRPSIFPSKGMRIRKSLNLVGENELGSSLQIIEDVILLTTLSGN